MYKKAMYPNSIYIGTVTNPADVVRDFFQDLDTRRPACVTENSTRVFVSFTSGCSLTAYTLPRNYKRFITEV